MICYNRYSDNIRRRQKYLIYGQIENVQQRWICSIAGRTLTNVLSILASEYEKCFEFIFVSDKQVAKQTEYLLFPLSKFCCLLGNVSGKSLGHYFRDISWIFVVYFVVVKLRKCVMYVLRCKGGHCSKMRFLKTFFFWYASVPRRLMFTAIQWISRRPRSQNISKESTLNPEKDSTIKRPRWHVSSEKSSQNYKPLENWAKPNLLPDVTPQPANSFGECIWQVCHVVKTRTARISCHSHQPKKLAKDRGEGGVNRGLI